MNGGANSVLSAPSVFAQTHVNVIAAPPVFASFARLTWALGSVAPSPHFALADMEQEEGVESGEVRVVGWKPAEYLRATRARM